MFSGLVLKRGTRYVAFVFRFEKVSLMDVVTLFSCVVCRGPSVPS